MQKSTRKKIKVNFFQKNENFFFRCPSKTIKIDNENRHRLWYDDTLALPYRPHLKIIPSFFPHLYTGKKMLVNLIRWFHVLWPIFRIVSS